METTGTTVAASSFATALVEQVGAEVYCAEKGNIKAFASKLLAGAEALPFGVEKEVEVFALKQAIKLLGQLDVVCGCPDIAPVAAV